MPVSWPHIYPKASNKKFRMCPTKLIAGAGGADYYVLDTDYVTYAAVYNCFSIGEFKVEYAWILARANSLSPEELTFARNVFIANGVDISTFEPTYQDSKCVYFP